MPKSLEHQVASLTKRNLVKWVAEAKRRHPSDGLSASIYITKRRLKPIYVLAANHVLNSMEFNGKRYAIFKKKILELVRDIAEAAVDHELNHKNRVDAQVRGAASYALIKDAFKSIGHGERDCEKFINDFGEKVRGLSAESVKAMKEVINDS
ncbi:MAG TPA: hypothetical protein VFF13_06770 [archaeon]|nr:hypothetical protein [archaeon]